MVTDLYVLEKTNGATSPDKFLEFVHNLGFSENSERGVRAHIMSVPHSRMSCFVVVAIAIVIVVASSPAPPMPLIFLYSSNFTVIQQITSPSLFHLSVSRYYGYRYWGKVQHWLSR